MLPAKWLHVTEAIKMQKKKKSLSLGRESVLGIKSLDTNDSTKAGTGVFLSEGLFVVDAELLQGTV